ncbi:PAS domain S-box protein [Paraneptunicella aestuarii]|uniref:PAS domain-containing sensor histidine kinase n=1 Tax=Paraneptunicella aestuarii TaxID=2831148 RepID=UPI001E397EA9|nr:PAS domain-containing sensor histidine kinase [Paraneptunicella aestuarii]UAA39005.1 PAS domain S-box protein [Paraneptunicella aestuarii]
MNIKTCADIIAVLPEAILLLDSGGNVLSANSAALTLLKREKTQVENRPVASLLTSLDETKVQPNLKRWLSSKKSTPTKLNFLVDNISCNMTCAGNLIIPQQDGCNALVMLRLTENKSQISAFQALTTKTQQQEKEIRLRRKTEKELEEKERKARMILNAASDAIFGVDESLHCIFANKVCLDILGCHSLEEINDHGIFNILYPVSGNATEQEVFQRLLDAHHQKHSHDSQDATFKTLSKSLISVELTLVPYSDMNGNSGSVITFRDISVRKTTEAQLIRSQQSLKQAQSIANIGSWEWDLQHEEIYWTDQVYRILDLEPQLFRPDYNAFLAFVPKEERAGLDKAIQDFKAQLQGELNIEHSVLESNGTTKIVNLRAKLFNDDNGKPTKIIGSIQDITEKKLAEEEIRSLNADLELRVEERTAALNTSNVALQQSLDQLQQTQHQLVESEKMAALGGLVAGVAHEINTPVGVSVTAASHLSTKLNTYKQKYLADELTCDDFERLIDSSSKACGLILNNLERAANLISSFKKIAVDQTSDEPRKLNMRQYLDEIISSLTPQLKRLNPDIQIDCDESLNFYTHPGAISQVLTNLVMNSIVHGFEEPTGRKETISISVEHDNNNVTIHYLDNGKGLNEEQKAKIFNPFFTTKRDSGGSGLGMHIVYNLVSQTLQGTITLILNQQEGVGFIITFPLHTDAQQRGVRESAL